MQFNSEQALRNGVRHCFLIFINNVNFLENQNFIFKFVLLCTLKFNVLMKIMQNKKMSNVL